MLINDNGYFMTGSQEVVGSYPLFSIASFCYVFIVRNIPNRRLEWCLIQESRSLQSEIDTVKNADAVNSLCTVNTVHGLRDCRKDGKPIQCPILLTFS